MPERPKILRPYLEKITITFSIILLLTMGMVFYSTGGERVDEFIRYHSDISNKATHNASYEIANLISRKKTLVKNFLEDNHDLISQLANTPGNIDLHDTIDKKIKKYFIDYFSFSIADQNGVMLVDDFDGKVGEICKTDTKAFVKNNQQLIRIHPNPDVYHFDLLTRFHSDDTSYIFFVTFNTDEITSMLRASSRAGHDLLMRFKGMENLIEVTSTGSRNTISDRLDFRLTDNEKNRILTSYKIPGTVWDVVDIHDPDLFKNYKQSIIFRSTTTYVIFILMTLAMSIVMIIEMRKKSRIESALISKNNEIETLNTELERLSITDSLTGLYNRRYIDNHAIAEWNRAKRTNTHLHITLIDIDHFKQYNDQYGHVAGDRCLAIVGRLLSTSFRRNSEFSARYGGEEFIIFSASETNEEIFQRVKDVAEKIAKKNMDPSLSGKQLHITVSAGIASSNLADIDSLEKLIDAADSALYEAKNTGRCQVIMKE